MLLGACDTVPVLSPAVGAGTGPWPNEPPGLTTLSDYGFDDPIPVTGNLTVPVGTSGWSVYANPVGNGSHALDPDAPFSPPDVYQVEYPKGFVGGAAPATLEYDFSPRPRELYSGFWWKPSDPFQGHSSNVNKIVFVMTPTQQSSDGALDLLYFDMVRGPWRIFCQNDLLAGGGPTAGALLTGNVTQTNVALGQWHRIEIYLQYSTGANADGVVQWWVDGQLNGSYTNLKMVQDGGFKDVQFSPTWGGGSQDTKAENDYFWFDHVHLSGR